MLETDWDLCVYGSPDIDLMRRIFDGRWRFEHAHLPRRLNRLFADAGLTPTHAEAFRCSRRATTPTRSAPACSRSAATPPSATASTGRRRRLGRRRVARGAAGDWFFCLNRFMFVATKA